MTDIELSSPDRAHSSAPFPSSDRTADPSKSVPVPPPVNPPEQLSPEAQMRPLSLQRSLQRRGSLPKPRSNSSLTSSRPAPPSPAPSRPSSQVLDSPTASLHSVGFASPGPGTSSPGGAFGSSGLGGRDRSCSSASRRSLKARPKSLLGLVSTSAAMGGGLETAQEEELERERAEAERTEADEAEEQQKEEKGGPGLNIDGTPTPPDAERESHSHPSTRRPSLANRGSTPLTPATLSALNALNLESGSATPRAPNPAFEAEAAVTRRVRVRDYAFVSTDLRHVGLGPQRSRSNWSEGEPEPSVPQQSQQSEWGLGGFGAGFGFGATFGPSSAGAEQPSSTGLSFGLGSWTKRDDEDVADHSASDYWSEDDDLDEPHAVYYPPGNEPDGLFRTAYSFAPEGINEIAIEVGEFLDVRGRGGGEGWVVGTRLRDGIEGLVPEGYLEQCDEGDTEFEVEWEKVREMRRSRETEETPSSGQSGNSVNDEVERW